MVDASQVTLRCYDFFFVPVLRALMLYRSLIGSCRLLLFVLLPQLFEGMQNIHNGQIMPHVFLVGKPGLALAVKNNESTFRDTFALGIPRNVLGLDAFPRST